MTIKDIFEKLNIRQLNPMQMDAGAGIVRTDKDVVILSPTGTGKTLAYLLPLVGILNPSSEALQAIVIVPGRELALQSSEVLNSMKAGIRSVCCYGGRPAMEEHKTLKQVMPHVVFGTPGRLNDHIDKGNISTDKVSFVVLDEFDKCLEMGFRNEMAKLIDAIPSASRRILLSATDAEQIPGFVNMGRVIKIDYTDDEEQVSGRVDVSYLKSPVKDKLETLSFLLRFLGDGSSIVFLNYRDSVERTAEYLRKQGFSVSGFHGGLEQKMREDALYKFSNGSSNVFVSTDLASRGLDIPDIDNIIHYHLPDTEESYIHRVGRTARWQASGKAFFLLGPGEMLPEFVRVEPQELILPPELPLPPQPRMATLYIGKGKKDKISKGDIVGYLCKKGGLEPNEIGRIDVKDRYAYVAVCRQKLPMVLKQTRGEKIKGIRTVVEPVR